ncbi:hypothetical protein FNV43_RR02753 [Rhamnella rubrinervis]|uniref:GTD-binding domain-containing protein n=1 Tax=Rhamnella rubrinervis TaxID=2594499 RepID=A0A8K0HH63_9ROSA|nr:hypothetical protein FNV43_RR02753 [Rhamnella rubrinervis]
MAVMGVSSAKPLKTSQGFAAALVSAFLEWLLIFLLFIDAIFGYVIKKFACGCKLQTPCLLCSRLDHVLGKERRGYYWELMCNNHKLETSSLVLCHAHNKLVDIHEMCGSCLSSFATISKSNAETYRLLVGKLGENGTSNVDQDPLLGDAKFSSSSRRHCSCCNEPLGSRRHAWNLIQRKLISPLAAELDVPLSGPVEHNQEDLKKGVEMPNASVGASHPKNRGLDPLSHVEYTELKIFSDTESEAVLSDDDKASSVIRGTNDLKEELSVQLVDPRIINLDNDLALAVPVDAGKLHDSISRESSFAIGHGLEELNWQQVGFEADFPTLTEPALEAASPSSDAMETPIKVSEDECKIKPFPAYLCLCLFLLGCLSSFFYFGFEMFHYFALHSAVSSHYSVVGLLYYLSHAMVSLSIDVKTTCENGQTSLLECGEVSKAGDGPSATSETGVETDTVSSDTGNQVSIALELGEAYKLAVGDRGKQLSGVISEQWFGKDSSRVSEDLKLLISQLSAARGFDRSISDMSPKLSVTSDDMKTIDAAGMHLLQKRISLERNESGLSLDGSIVSEIEGESAVDRLKRQVEHDKKLLIGLYRELEEERNASAIAANQAMAMITRLQEEKAALQMEASQYLRMMEEQAEYDNEELQNTNDLLAEKEKEIQDLEAELEFYRIKYPNESMLENPAGTISDTSTRDIGVDHSESSGIGDGSTVVIHPVSGEPNPYNKVEGADIFFGNDNVKNSLLLGFEDDKRYILQCLKKLEKTLYPPSDDVKTYLSESQCPENGRDGISESEVLKNDVSSLENAQLNGKELCGNTNLDSLGNEVSHLTKMLEALDADRKFLEHSINSLRTGDEGLQFIQEIASHLQEFRKAANKKDQTVA